MTSTQQRRCSVCKEIKFVDQFYKSEFNPERRCIECYRSSKVRKPKPRILEKLYKQEEM